MFRLDTYYATQCVNSSYFANYAAATQTVAKELAFYATLPSVDRCCWVLIELETGIPVATYGSTQAVMDLGIIE